MRSVRLTDEAREALQTLPRWVNKSRFVAKVVYGDDRLEVKLAESTAFRQPRESVVSRSALLIDAVRRIRDLELCSMKSR